MPIILPLARPTMSLAIPPLDRHYSDLELTNGQVLSDNFGGQYLAGTDERGRYITVPQGIQTVNLSPQGPLPDFTETPQVAVLRIRARNLTPFWSGAVPGYTSGSSAAAGLVGLPGGLGLTAQRQGVGDPEYLLSPAGPQVAADASYLELRVALTVGEAARWYAFDPVEGEGAGAEGIGAEPVEQLLEPVWVTNLSLNTNPSLVDPERVRLYRLDVWLDPQDAYGVPPLRHRQNSLNSGGPPLRHRQNGGQSGGPLLRHRQTGL